MVPLRSFLRDESEIAVIAFHLVYDLKFLLTTQKVFLWQGGDAEKPDCRNQALGLSKEVKKSILEAGSALESSDKRGKAGKKFGIRLKAQATKLNDFANEHHLVYITNLHGQQDAMWLKY